MQISTPIFDMFARSPLRPLQEHMAKVNACAEALIDFFQTVQAEDWNKANQLQIVISDLEREADRIKTDLRIHLPHSLFLPVSRSDLLETLISQDRIANKAKDIAGIVLGRRLEFPSELNEDFNLFLCHCVDASKQALQAINELDELLETGFRSNNEVNLVHEMIHKLDAIEQDTDEMQIKLRKKLFGIENKLSPVDVIFLYKIIEWTGDLADLAQVVGGQLQLLLAR